MGILNESGGSVIGTDNGVMKAKDFRRQTILTEWWNKEYIGTVKGTLWEPIPGRAGHVAIKPGLYPGRGAAEHPSKGERHRRPHLQKIQH